MPPRSCVLLPLLLSLPTTACTVQDPLYCDERTPCTDPARSFCDLEGTHSASGGVSGTCIPDPDPEVDAGPESGGDETDGGASEPDAASGRRIVQIATGERHTCAVLSDGGLRCWGEGRALGYPETDDVGDNEHPYKAGDVPTGGAVKQVAAGDSMTCALYSAGNIRCWGASGLGSLGYGHTEDLFGPGETPDLLPDVDLGGPASQVVAGGNTVCALLVSGDVRCWGSNVLSQLATGDQETVGDNEVPASRSPVPIGGKVTQLSAGDFHMCAVVEGGFVRCWGTVLRGFGGVGPLGHGGTESVGDDETPQQAGSIDIGGAASLIAAGSGHTCALLSEGQIRCWGVGAQPSTSYETLGYRELDDIGDDEPPVSAGDIDLGGEAAEVAAAGTGRCARLTSGAVRCWGGTGAGATGVLGYGNDEAIGDNETPAEVGDVELGGAIVQLSSGSSTEHICALLEEGVLRCWGFNGRGELGLGHTDNIGDTEKPGDVDPVRVLE